MEGGSGVTADLQSALLALRRALIELAFLIGLTLGLAAGLTIGFLL